MFSGSVGEEEAVQLLVPQVISPDDFIMEFLAFEEGLLCCSVESLHLTTCLGVIGTGNVVLCVCELIELASNLEMQKKKKIQNYIKLNIRFSFFLAVY